MVWSDEKLEKPRLMSTNRRKHSNSDSNVACSPKSAKRPSKSFKIALETMETETPSAATMYAMLVKIQQNTDKILKENSDLKRMYDDFLKSLEHHIDKIVDLQTENVKLKTEVSELRTNISGWNREICRLEKELMLQTR